MVRQPHPGTQGSWVLEILTHGFGPLPQPPLNSIPESSGGLQPNPHHLTSTSDEKYLIFKKSFKQRDHTHPYSTTQHRDSFSQHPPWFLSFGSDPLALPWMVLVGGPVGHLKVTHWVWGQREAGEEEWLQRQAGSCPKHAPPRLRQGPPRLRQGRALPEQISAVVPVTELQRMLL